jgi:hypothetical protein
MKIRITLLMAVVVMLGMSSCEKYNQIDNSSTVKTPYVLFIGGYNGTLHKTNESLYFNTWFPTDNSCIRQVVVADTNIMYLKHNFYTSRDNGLSFPISNDHALDFIDEFYKYYYPNSALYDKSAKKVYLCTKTGLEVSTDLGYTFTPETDWDVTNTAMPPAKPPTSITQLDNGTLFLMYDSSLHFYKAPGASWKNMLADNVNDLPRDTTWYFSHSHDTLIAIDFFGKYGVQYSTNNGADWAAVPGIPKRHKLLFGNQAFGTEAFYVGIDSGGLYRMNATNFSSTSAGIPWYAKVSYVEGKRVVYRTDVARYYQFCATDHGLYISETNGLDWKLTRSGTYSTLR